MTVSETTSPKQGVRPGFAPSPPKGRRTLWPAALLAVLLAIFIALRFAQPIEDGDLFWHMLYGSQMVSHHSLAVDHSQFSWMPASNRTAYVAWTGELLFLVLWKTLGISGIFLLRYATVLAVAGLLALYARRCSLLARPEIWLVILVTVLTSIVATLPKPEMLSLVLWNALVFTWFQLQFAHDEGRPLRLWIYAAPAITLLWVNTHGGFVLAAPFIVLTAVYSFYTLPKRESLHAAAAGALCAIATVINPYGIRYPLQLLAEALGVTRRPDFDWNSAFQPTSGAAGTYYHLPEFLIWMTLALAAVAYFHRRRGRAIVWILFLAYVPLYLRYVRSTFLLPAIFGYGVLYLARRSPGFSAKPRRLSTAFRAAATAAFFLFFSSRALYAEFCHPQAQAWMGFGIAYSQPVDEAEYLAHTNLGKNLYNTYNMGGYLLWRLYPRNLVMVDARSFPYTDWFDELHQFSTSRYQDEFARFLHDHPADAAVVDFQQGSVWRNFLNTPGWRPVFYGPAAAVFARTANTAPIRAAASLDHLRNAETAAAVFDFATGVADYSTAWRIQSQLEGPLRPLAPPETLARIRSYHAAHDSLLAGDYERAWTRFNEAFRRHSIDGRDQPAMYLLHALHVLPPGDPRAASLRDGIARLERAQ